MEPALDASAPENVGVSTAQSAPELARRLSSASLWAFVVYVGGAGLTCLAQLVIARKIGAPSYGIYSYVSAWTILLSYIAALGFNIVLLRFLAAYCATEQWSLARGIIRFAFGRSLLVAMVIAICGIAAALSLAHSFPHELAIGMATVPLTALYVLGSAAVRALGGVISALAPERLVRDGLMVALVVLAGMLSATPVNATTVLIALMVSSAVTAGILGLSLRILWPPQLRSAVPAYAPGDWWHLALPVMIMIGLDVLMSRAGVFLLGWIGDTRAAGIFALGLNLALFLVLPRMAVGTFFSPTVSKLHAQQNEAALQSLFARATVLSLVGTVALALPLLFLTEPLLRLFGEDFVATAPIARILVVGQIFAAATGPQLNLLTMTGHERAAAAILMVGAALNVVACAIGIAFFGAIGAAVATAATNVAWNAAMAVYIYKRVNMIAGLLFAVVEFRGPAAAG
jgi:O-antigen/teichoic acid export membrane protein